MCRPLSHSSHIAGSHIDSRHIDGRYSTRVEEQDTPRPGIAAFIARHRTLALITAGAALFALLGTGAVVAGASTLPAHAPAAH